MLIASPIFSIDFSADYIEGYLDLKDGSGWSEVYIGDLLPANAVVKLDQDSYAELSYGNDTIKLSRPGTYELSKLIGAKSQVADSGSSLFTGKFKTFIQEDTTKTQSTVGGVRAAEAETVSIDWMSSETADLIKSGKEALEAGNTDDAHDFFSEAYDFAADEFEESEALYFMGLTAAMKGDYLEALDNLDMAYVEDDSEYYTDYYLLKGQLLVESFAYDEAFKFLNEYKASAGKNTPDKLQQIYYMIAVSGSNAGERNAAVSAINKLIAIDPNSDTAKAAKKYKDKI